MNLFILSLSQKEIAESMFDSHIVKIILEAVQMLCTAKLLLDPEDPTNEKLYKISHKNHPVSIWVRKSYANYMWTLKLVNEMHNEWQFRYNHHRDKYHRSYLIAYHLLLNPPPKDKFECKGLTSFAQAMPQEYKVENDAVQAYKLYYMSEPKKKLAKWTKRSPPIWYKM
jgi:hypothetical protein